MFKEVDTVQMFHLQMFHAGSPLYKKSTIEGVYQIPE